MRFFDAFHRSHVRRVPVPARVIMAVMFPLLSLAAYAATYVAPSGYFQIIGYKLQREARKGFRWEAG